MKTKKRYAFVICLAGMVICVACGSSASRPARQQQAHWAEVNNPALGSLYADEVDPARVMQVTDSGTTKFVAYKIGLREEKIPANNQYMLDRGKYLQFDMQHDWSLKSQSDSFGVVFFQPVVKKIDQVDESILIFEIPAGVTPDTLIYQDSFGGWGTQKIILSGH
ncbi:MAG: hypothetical protein DI535_14080 [Citrobacter freundii]|nr:MAG: hypothetical protein DI535_14080 [Citrobacter freundii]